MGTFVPEIVEHVSLGQILVATLKKINWKEIDA
jgi:hypothetical protein